MGYKENAVRACQVIVPKGFTDEFGYVFAILGPSKKIVNITSCVDLPLDRKLAHMFNKKRLTKTADQPLSNFLLKTDDLSVVVLYFATERTSGAQLKEIKDLLVKNNEAIGAELLPVPATKDECDVTYVN